jgi:hypothetical protein
MRPESGNRRPEREDMALRASVGSERSGAAANLELSGLRSPVSGLEILDHTIIIALGLTVLLAAVGSAVMENL